MEEPILRAFRLRRRGLYAAILALIALIIDLTRMDPVWLFPLVILLFLVIVPETKQPAHWSQTMWSLLRDAIAAALLLAAALFLYTTFHLSLGIVLCAAILFIAIFYLAWAEILWQPAPLAGTGGHLNHLIERIRRI